MSRYEIVGDFTERTRHDLTYYHDVRRIIITEVADLRDTQGGRVHEDGAYRVRVEPHYSGAPRTKTFKGESAWSLAANYADQVAREIMHENHEEDG